MQTYYPHSPYPDAGGTPGFKRLIKYETWDIEKFGSCTEQSRNIALKELEQGRTVVILFPAYLSAAVFEMSPPPEGVYQRFDSTLAGLKSLRVDTLILVRPKEMAQEAINIAMTTLQISLEPKIIRMPGNMSKDV